MLFLRKDQLQQHQPCLRSPNCVFHLIVLEQAFSFLLIKQGIMTLSQFYVLNKYRFYHWICFIHLVHNLNLVVFPIFEQFSKAATGFKFASTVCCILWKRGRIFWNKIWAGNILTNQRLALTFHKYTSNHNGIEGEAMVETILYV